MNRIQIPFKPVMISAILQGKKCCTSRTRKYGIPGDHFEIHGNKYELVVVSLITLKYVSIHYYKDEGVSSTEEFIHLWERIHPVRGFIPEQEVYVHWFKKI